MANSDNLRPLGEDNEEDKLRRSGGEGYAGDDDFDADDLDDDFGDDLDDLAGDFDDDFDDADDDLEGDEEDDEEDDEEQSHLLEQFQGEDYRIVDLKELSALDDIEDDELSAIEPTLTLDEVLYRLWREADELPMNELAALSDLARPEADEVRRVWPQINLLRRRSVIATVADLYAGYLGLDFSAFLRIAIDDSDAVVRRFAILGLNEEGAAPDLLGRYMQMLQSEEDVAVRAAAAAALGVYILEGELEELDAALAMRAEQALMAVLTNPQEPIEVQCRALESIAYSGELGVRQLIEDAYYSPEDERRLSSLVAMGRSADIRWRRLARAELTNPDGAMRAQAAYACGELEARSALPDLLKMLGDAEQRVRLAAIFALGHTGGPRANAALQAIVRSGDEVEAFAAEQALEEMDFYAGMGANSVPLYDESEAADNGGDEADGWDGEWEGEDDEDDNLGQYE